MTPFVNKDEWLKVGYENNWLKKPFCFTLSNVVLKSIDVRSDGMGGDFICYTFYVEQHSNQFKNDDTRIPDRYLKNTSFKLTGIEETPL